MPEEERGRQEVGGHTVTARSLRRLMRAFECGEETAREAQDELAIEEHRRSVLERERLRQEEALAMIERIAAGLPGNERKP